MHRRYLDNSRIWIAKQHHFSDYAVGMPIRVSDIAAEHRGDLNALVAKAKALGFRVRGGSTSLDRITAEALELAVYGEAAAVRFDMPHSPGAEGRLAHLRSLIAMLREALNKTGLNRAVEHSAKLLAHMLAVCRSKDWNGSPPPEWEEAQALIGQLAHLGIQVQVEELPRKHVSERPPTKQRPEGPASRQAVLAAQKLRNKKRKRARRKTKKKRKPWLLFTPFETNRRRH